VNITDFRNSTYYHPQMGYFYAQEVIGDFYMWNGIDWDAIDFGGMGNSMVIGSANDYFPLFMTQYQHVFPYILPSNYEISDVAKIWEAVAEHGDFDIVTYGDRWVKLYNSSTGGFKKYLYNKTGIMELMQGVNIETEWDDIYTGMYLKNSTTIDDTKIQKFEMETLGTDDFNVTLKISVTADTDLLYSAFNINPINISLSYGALFIDVWVNNSDNLDQTNFAPINITIEFDPAQYKNMKLYWFNVTNPEDPLEVWQAIPFTNYGNGTIFFTVNHTSIFVFTNIPLYIIIGDGDDDDDDDDKPAQIPFGNSYLIFLAIGIIGLIIYTRRKYKTNKY